MKKLYISPDFEFWELELSDSLYTSTEPGVSEVDPGVGDKWDDDISGQEKPGIF